MRKSMRNKKKKKKNARTIQLAFLNKYSRPTWFYHTTALVVDLYNTASTEVFFFLYSSGSFLTRYSSTWFFFSFFKGKKKSSKSFNRELYFGPLYRRVYSKTKNHVLLCLKCSGIKIKKKKEKTVFLFYANFFS